MTERTGLKRRLLETLIQIAIVGVIGTLFVEWCASPKGFERFITPLHDKIIRRYEYVQRRKE